MPEDDEQLGPERARSQEDTGRQLQDALARRSRDRMGG